MSEQIEAVYGSIALSIYNVYLGHNPLRLSEEDSLKYWENVRGFLQNIHEVLYDTTHKLSINSIKPESYFFLVKMCIDKAFSIGDLINVRNDSKEKYAKNMANDIAYNILPQYITYRRQMTNTFINTQSNQNTQSAQSAQSALKTKPAIKRKFIDLIMPKLSSDDNIPLNFYNAYCRESGQLDPALSHKVPYISPIMNRPGPPEQSNSNTDDF